MKNFVKSVLVLLIVLLSVSLNVDVSFAQNNAIQFCSSMYEKNNECPDALCRIDCIGGTPDKKCTQVCKPKECEEIDAESCPLESCQILKGCSGEDVCYHKLINEPMGCGNISYAGQSKECCAGLVKRCGEEFFDGTCDMIGAYTLYSVPICIPCGNGFCNQFEDACNCPEDCS